ncbi:hypothetical protein [Pseudoalteromonas byunsanensis]|uniref:Uncharacterized protein n=1 Tax=Pseudoalteromonas byunsanensis TaxID=327939 RepID=A0A1S1NGD1_9GAMM|nr:hypothetical protein [Pseudoalteromonas byunsanensis]OHU97981.1 hypothetical protein BIW53_00185 [Pseudoalteromonas byunsanensis]
MNLSKLGLLAVIGATTLSGVANASSYQYSEFHWKQGENQVSLGSSRDRVCFLSGVQGHFEGWGESVYVGKSGASYYLGGKSNQDAVEARATCVVNPKGDKYTQFDTWEQGQSDLYLGDRHNVCFLTAMAGKFEGWKEVIEVKNTSYGVYLGGSSDQHSVKAGAACLSRYNPSLKSYTWKQGESAKILAPSANTVCYLTKVSGKFEGSGEWVRLSQNNGYWMLNGASQQRDVTATATCTSSF